MAGPFRKRHAIACANQTFDYMLFLLNCLRLIKICAYSHVTITQAAATDY